MNLQISKTPLPATKEDLLANKTMVTQPTLNDHVDGIHVTLWGMPEYRAYHDAVSDEDAVEGWTSIDNMKAAEMIRQYALDHDMGYVGKKKLASIVKALNVVCRRYHMSRKERAVTIGGEIVPGNGD